jgi:hypothetical protein
MLKKTLRKLNLLAVQGNSIIITCQQRRGVEEEVNMFKNHPLRKEIKSVEQFSRRIEAVV